MMVSNQEGDFHLMNFQTRGGKLEETLLSSELRQTQFWKWQHRTVHHPNGGRCPKGAGTTPSDHKRDLIYIHRSALPGLTRRVETHTMNTCLCYNQMQGGESRQSIAWVGLLKELLPLRVEIQRKRYEGKHSREAKGKVKKDTDRR